MARIPKDPKEIFPEIIADYKNLFGDDLVSIILYGSATGQDKAYRKKIVSIWGRDTVKGVRVGEENPRVFTVRCKDGQEKIIDFRRIDLIDGKQYQIYEDITVRATAEEALRESEERYRTLVENIDFTIKLDTLAYKLKSV